MQTKHHQWISLVIFAVCIGANACAPAAEQDEDDPLQDVPVTGGANIEAWLSTKAYQKWKCQFRPHPAVSPSPHGFNRVCINAIGALSGTGELPVDTSLVKEFIDGSGAIVGYSTERHTRAGADGSTWYWYERVLLGVQDPLMPHDEKGVVADGWGFDSPAADICVKCHATAGKNGHTGHDFVFTFP
jgi:hypothetical protein